MPRAAVDWRRVEQKDFPSNVEAHWRGSPFSIAIPDEASRGRSSTGDLGYYYAIGEAWAQVISNFLPESPTVLDIGCSYGRLARFLLLNPGLRYTGFDVDADAIAWCQREFKRIERLRFVHADLDSAFASTFAPSGRTSVRDYEFPVESESVDMAVAASLFTHLFEPEAVHYLEEIQRVLKNDATALISLHIDVPAGQVYSGDPLRIDVDPEYFIGLAGKVGLRPVEIVGNVYGQHLVLFAKQSD
jgi:SAM-dependent methyltransferase